MSKILAPGRRGVSTRDMLGTSSPASTATSIEKSNDFKATTPTNWDGASPEEMQDAIDRLSALIADWSSKLEDTGPGGDGLTMNADYSNKP